MPGVSAATEPIAGRVAIGDAAEIRRLAAEQSTTVSLVLKNIVQQQLAHDAVRTAGK